MKKIIKIFILFLTICSAKHSYAQIGCMDNSKHLDKAVDTKTYNYVQCNCECSKHTLSSDRGICSNCGHYHEPVKIEIVCVEKK